MGVYLENGLGYADILVSSFDEVAWKVPEIVPAPVSSNWTDNTPAISADGNSLYFSSYERTGGLGKQGIYVSECR